MQVTNFSGATERPILLGVIVSDTVCGRVAACWTEDGLFGTKTGNVLGKLCVDYFNRWGRAPKHDIEMVASSWAEGKDDRAVGEVDDFLRSLRGEYDELAKRCNADVVIDQAGDHFTQVRLRKIFEGGSALLLQGKTKQALELVNTIQPVEMGLGSYVDPFDDDELIRELVHTPRESMVKYPGDLGAFFGPAFEPESLVAIEASAKSAKSFWLMDIALTTLEQGRTVAFFQCGDLTRRQFYGRMATRMAGRPLFLREGERVRRYRVPLSMAVAKGKALIEYEDMEVTTSLSEKKIRQHREDYNDKYDARNRWRLSVHSSNTVSIADIRQTLRRWERQGWGPPDMVVIDYDALLKPMNGKMETRDQINANWTMFSQMRQDLHCVVLVATQADAGSYETDLIRRKNFSGDRRKNDHVTAMFALNQTDKEKEDGVWRINWLNLRDDPSSERQVAFVAGCLSVARPHILSYYKPGGDER